MQAMGPDQMQVLQSLQHMAGKKQKEVGLRHIDGGGHDNCCYGGSWICEIVYKERWFVLMGAQMMAMHTLYIFHEEVNLVYKI